MRYIFTTVTFLLAVLFTTAQSLQKALSLFNENKRAEAKSMLLDLENNTATTEKAALAMVLLELSNEHPNEAFEHFKKFYNTTAYPYPYMYALWSTGIFNQYGKVGADIQQLMEKIVRDSAANQTIKAMAYDHLAGRLQNAGNITQAKAIWGKINEIIGWSTVGTFENVSASGFYKDFGILSHPETTSVFKNNRGADVRWFAIPEPRNDRWTDFEFHYNITNSVIYSQTFIQSDTYKEVIFRFGVSGSFKIWLNDRIVGAEDEERNTDLDVYNYKVTLLKGYNRVLVQVGNSELNRSNFMLRMTDIEGNTIPCTGSPTFQPYDKTTVFTVQHIPLFAEQFFENKIRDNSDNFLDKIMLLHVYNHNDKHFAARTLADQLKKQEPKSTLVSERVIESLARDNNITDLSKEMEFIKSNDPESLYGLMLLFNDALQKEKVAEAQRLLDKRIELFGNNADTEIKNLTLMGKRKETEKLLQQLSIAIKTYPENRDFLLMEYNRIHNITNDLKKSTALLERFLKTHYDDELTEIVSNNLAKLGKKEEHIHLLQKMIEDKPYMTNRYADISSKYYDQQDYVRALQWQQKAAALAPYESTIHHRMGLIFEALGNKAEAEKALKRAIGFNPNNYEARKKLATLTNKKEWFTSFKTENIDTLLRNNIQQSDYPNDNSVYLLKNLQQIVYPENGASEERNEIVIKILNQSGINDWKELSIPFNGYTQRLIIDKAELFKKEGSKVLAEKNGNQIVFSSLEVGDVVHLSYTLENSSYGKLAEHFWETFNFNDGYPVKLARYSLQLPKEKKFQYKLYHVDITPSVDELKDDIIYTWEQKNMASIKSEPHMPPFADVAERIVVTSIPDWNYVANWYSDLSSIKTKDDYEVKETAKELFNDRQSLTDLEKAKIIYEYIENNFNYSAVPFLHSALTPQRASRTITARLGDCKDLSVLFVALCKEVGLDANLVLVDTKDNGDTNLDLPTIDFNHCIAQLKTEGKNYFIELTDNHLPFGALGMYDLNANSLCIPKPGETVSTARLIPINTPDRPGNLIDRTAHLNFTNNNAVLQRATKKVGAEAALTRSLYKHLGEEDRSKNLLQSLSGNFNKKLILNHFSFTNLDNLKDTIEMNYTCTIENFTNEISGMQIFALPWSDSNDSMDFLNRQNRKYPFCLWNFSNHSTAREVLNIHLPPGKKLVEAPKNIRLSSPFMSYELSFNVQADQIIATREVRYFAHQVPVASYNDFKAFMEQVKAADSKQFGFK